MCMKKQTIIILFLILTVVLLGWNFTQKANREDGNSNNKILSREDITFFVATDIHYLSDKINDGGKAFKEFVDSGDGKQLYYIDEILEAFIFDIERKNPNVLIISGDLTNNGEEDSHIDFAKKLKKIEEKGTSVYVIPGNHDISNPWVRGFKEEHQYVVDSINEEDFSEIYSEFGYQEAVSKDKESLSYLAAPSEDIWLLMLDTSKYKNNEKLGYPQTDGEFSPSTLDWIRESHELAKEKGATILTVMHHNLLNHSDVIQRGFTLNNNEEALELFQDYNVNLSLSGHIHVQDISSTQKGERKVYDIATGSMAVNPHQYGVISYDYENHSLDYQTSNVEVEYWSIEKEIQDHYLQNFTDYAEEFFAEFAYEMAYENLQSEDQFSEGEKKAMAEIMRTLNVRYFAGTEHLNSNDLFSKEGYLLWEKSTSPFLSRYIKSISNDLDTNDNQLHIELES